MEPQDQFFPLSSSLIPHISNGAVTHNIFPYLTQQDLWNLSQTSKILQAKIEQTFKKHYQSATSTSLLPKLTFSNEEDECISYLAYYLLRTKIQNPHSFYHPKWFSEESMGEAAQNFSFKVMTEKIIDKAFVPATSNYLKGILAEMRSDFFAAGEYYSQSSHTEAQWRIANAVLDSELNHQLVLNRKKKFENLAKLAKEGNPFAHRYMIDAIYKGTLDQSKRPDQDRLQDILQFVEQGDETAKTTLAHMIFLGQFGFEKRPIFERVEKLKKLAKEGNFIASERVATMVKVGFWSYQGRSEEERLAVLLEMAKNGDKAAKRNIVHMLISGEFGFKNKSLSERFEEVKRFAEEGDPYIQYEYDRLVLEGTLGQKSRPAEECFQELVERSLKGDHHAEKFVAFSVYEKTLGHKNLSDQERYEKLERLRDMGNRHAEALLAIWDDGRTEEVMFERLLIGALKGNRNMQGRLFNCMEKKKDEMKVKFAHLYFRFLNQIVNLNKSDELDPGY